MAFMLKFTFWIIPLLFAVGGVGADTSISSTKELHCPVCGMIPGNYPKWRTQISFRDGSMSAFDSPADMFRFLGNMAKYDNKHTSADIIEIQVADFIKKNQINARQAVYVSGSSARGPMGPDLPAFENKADAEFFARTAGGKILDFSQAGLEISRAPLR